MSFQELHWSGHGSFEFLTEWAEGERSNS